MLPSVSGKVVGAADFVAGFVFGMTNDNDLTQIQACFENSKETGTLMYSEIEAGIADLHVGGWNEDIQAAFEFGLVALQVPQFLHGCEGISTDIAALEAWAAIFKNPTELVSTATKHFLFHKKEIQSDIALLESDWSNDLEFKAGEDLAALLTLVVGPIDSNDLVMPPIDEVVPDYTAGLILGFTGNDHKEELEFCMSNLTPIATDAHNAIVDIKSGHLVKGLQDFGDIIYMLPDAVEGCEDLTELQADIDVMLSWAEQLKTPASTAKIASKNWLFHGVEIKKDISDEEAAWAAGDYFSAGQDTAAALLRTLPMPKNNELFL